MSPEEQLFHDVLRDLKNANLIFLKNWYTFAAMNPANRLRWIAHIKASAKTGVPFSVHLVEEVTKRRLKG